MLGKSNSQIEANTKFLLMPGGSKEQMDTARAKLEKVKKEFIGLKKHYSIDYSTITVFKDNLKSKIAKL